MALRSGLGLVAGFAAVAIASFVVVRAVREPTRDKAPPSPPAPPPVLERSDAPLPPPPESVPAPAPPPVQDAAPSYDRASLVRYGDAARESAASGTGVHATLAQFAAAEDFVRAAIEDAKKSGDKTRDVESTAIFKALLAESDAYAAKSITPAFIDATPWRDLLADASMWSRSTNVPGFTFGLAGGTITCTPPAPGGNREGVIGILDEKTDDLRHFVLEMEFQVDGLATVYFRVPPAPMPPSNRVCEAFDLTSLGAGGLRKDAKYLMRVEYVGSRITISFPDAQVATWAPAPSWFKRRRGGIAFRIPEGTHLSITRMRIKDLR